MHNDNPNIKSFIELHVEQDLFFSQSVKTWVLSLVLLDSRVHFTVFGEPNHGGTTPMSMRDDALVKAAEAVVYINKLANINGRLTATVGELQYHPTSSVLSPDVLTSQFSS